MILFIVDQNDLFKAYQKLLILLNYKLKFSKVKTSRLIHCIIILKCQNLAFERFLKIIYILKKSLAKLLSTVIFVYVHLSQF